MERRVSTAFELRPGRRISRVLELWLKNSVKWLRKAGVLAGAKVVVDTRKSDD